MPQMQQWQRSLDGGTTLTINHIGLTFMRVV